MFADEPRRVGELQAERCALKQRQLAPLRHGHVLNGRKSRTYKSWENMRDRCMNPKATSYASYGGRGITVVERWLVFQAFLADMGERPPGTSLDRKDGEKGYSPENCRWATAKVQARNRVGLQLVAHGGRQITIGELAEVTLPAGANLRNRYELLRRRIVDKRWTVSQALRTPVCNGRPHGPTGD